MSTAASRDIGAIFAAQASRAAERRQTFGLGQRRAALRALRDVLTRRERDIIAALAADFGKPETETLLTEILPVRQEIALALRKLPGWMRTRRVGPTLATLGTSARLRPEPRGTCLIIAPWNYPLNLALGPLVSCLAAGNSAIIKPSELTPTVAALLAEIVAEAFAPDLVIVVEGGVETATELLAHPFDHIFFTGSPEVGKIVMTAAAKHLSSVTLELGGKSPTIVGPGADVQKAAQWIAFGKFANAGQTCIAPDHVYVHESVRQPFLDALRARLGRAYGNGDSAHLARIVTPRHAQRLRDMLGNALTAGARLVTGGAGEGTQMPPTLIEAVTPEMQLDQDEIFGPILPILPYDDLDTVIARINERPKPLALYVFERDRAVTDHVIAATSSGGVGINLTLMHYTHHGLPFGGVNHSGHGAAHGEWGFHSFSHQRGILTNRWTPLPLLFPPYGARARQFARMARRWLG